MKAADEGEDGGEKANLWNNQDASGGRQKS
jgi:hypothetical protein